LAGNIRELQNIVERSVILSSGDTFWIERLGWPAMRKLGKVGRAFADTLQNHERKIIETA